MKTTEFLKRLGIGLSTLGLGGLFVYGVQSENYYILGAFIIPLIAFLIGCYFKGDL